MSSFRSSRANRSGRATADHDVFEGLPIRQWRVSDVSIAPPAQTEPAVDKNAFPELPMPKDSHMLPEHSQQLLRAARAGVAAKPAANANDDDKENDEAEDESKDVPRGFTVRRFTKLARHLEEPEVEYMAKRRKGLPSALSSLGIAAAPLASHVPMRKTKVRKLDAEGKEQIWSVLVPEGQTVDGEVLQSEAPSLEALPAPLPGTVVEGVGVVNAEGMVVASDTIRQTPQRIRRPPPPKKKHKGPGRGHKKVKFTNPDGSISAGPIDGLAQNGLAVPGATTSGTTPTGTSDADTPMGGTNEAEDDEEDDGEDGEDGDDDSEHEEGEMSESPSRQPTQEPPRSHPQDVHMTDFATDPPQRSTLPNVQVPEAAAVPVSDPIVASVVNLEPPPGPNREPSSSPDLPLADNSHSRSGSMHQIQGSSPATIPQQEETSQPPAAPIAEPVMAPIEAPIAAPVPPPIKTPIPAPIVSPIVSPIEPPPGPILQAPFELTAAPAEPTVQELRVTTAAPPIEPINDLVAGSLPPPGPPAPMEPAVAPHPPTSPQKTEIPISTNAPAPIAEHISAAVPSSIVLPSAPLPASAGLPYDFLPAPVPPPAPVEPAVQPELPAASETTGAGEAQVRDAPPAPEVVEQGQGNSDGEVNFLDGEPDLLGSLEAHLDK